MCEFVALETMQGLEPAGVVTPSADTTEPFKVVDRTSDA